MTFFSWHVFMCCSWGALFHSRAPHACWAAAAAGMAGVEGVGEEVARMVVAARANGLRPIDGPFGDFSDAAGYRAQALRAAVLGCEGKWAIHPSQVTLANELFSPSPAEVAKARRILKAMKEAQRAGQGAVALDGRLIDIASIRQAQVLVKKAREVGARKPRLAPVKKAAKKPAKNKKPAKKKAAKKTAKARC